MATYDGNSYAYICDKLRENQADAPEDYYECLGCGDSVRESKMNMTLRVCYQCIKEAE